MVSYTVEQHVQMIKLYYQNESSFVRTLRALRPFYGRRGGPSKSTLQRLVAKFETTGSVNNQQTPVRQRNVRSAENIAAVRESVHENPRQSIPRRVQELGISQTTLWRILREDIGLRNEDDAFEKEKSDKAASASNKASTDEEKKSKKHPQPSTRKPVSKKKRKSLNATDSGKSDGGPNSDYEQPKKTSKEASTDEDEKQNSKKRPQPTTRKPVPKKKCNSLNAIDSDNSDAGSNFDYEQSKKTSEEASKGGKSDGGSNSDYEQPTRTAPKKESDKDGGGASST